MICRLKSLGQEISEANEGIGAYIRAKEFLDRLHEAKSLTTGQYRALKSQALSGDIEGAEDALDRILKASGKRNRARGPEPRAHETRKRARYPRTRCARGPEPRAFDRARDER